MAIIKTIRNINAYTALLYEDPIPGATNLFIQNDAYDKTTLAYQFDVAMNFNTLGFIGGYGPYNGANHSGFGITTRDFTPGAATTAGSGSNYGSTSLLLPPVAPITGILQLNGETTHCRHLVYNVVAGDSKQNLDIAPFVSMDPTRRVKPTSYFTDGTNNIVMGVYHHNLTGTTGTDGWSYRYWLKINTSSSDLVNSNFVHANSSLITGYGGVTGNYQMWPIYRNPTTNNIIFAGQWASYSASTITVPYSMRGFIQGPAWSQAPTFAAPATSSTLSYSSQFVGVSSADGYAIFLENSALNDYTHNFYKLVDTGTQTVTNTALTAFSAIPTAAGSSAGGNRALTFGGNLPKYASSTFTETGSTTGFYIPYLDVNGSYVPFYMQWNRSTDAFTRNANVTVTYASGSFSTYFGVDTQSPTATGTVSAMNRLLWNETFTYSGTRYLMFGQVNGMGGVYDGNPTQRTFVCYSVNASDPKLLTYHSSIVVPLTPKNIVWLNDARTIIGIITHTNFYVYSFNGTTWVQTTNVPYQFGAVGRDNTGRIWAADTGPLGLGRLHLISSTTPVSITVTPASTSYTYAGSTVTSSVAVNAYDSTGARIATSVKLVINGSSMTFASSNLTTTVTTSASADTTVPIYIINGGVSNIIASAAI